MNDTSNTSNKKIDADKVQERYKGFDELNDLDDYIQDEIDVSSSHNK